MSTKQSKKTAERGTKAPSVAQDNMTASGPANQVSEDERRRMVAEAAYYRAQRRGFTAGGEVNDWLEAEREITQRFRGSAARHTRNTRVTSGGRDKAGMSTRH